MPLISEFLTVYSEMINFWGTNRKAF